MKVRKTEAQLMKVYPHRVGVTDCPECSKRSTEWLVNKNIEHIILHPASFYKPDSVIVISRCSECGELSWVHSTISGLLYQLKKDKVAKVLVDKVRAERVRRMRQATLDFYESPCMTCKKLEDVTFDYLYFCIKCPGGSGRPEKGSCKDKH